MKPATKRIINILAIFLLYGLFATSCKITAREEKFYERQEKKQAAEEQKAYDQKIKEHKKLQSDVTRKMMKDAERRSKKLNRSKRR